MKRIQSIMKTKQPRRGALLLVVLSILVLFALVGLTFVVSALAFNTGAQANLDRDLGAYEAPNEADAALMQLLRGPRPGTYSMMLGHDILRDMWGNQSIIISDQGAASADITQIERPQDANGNDINQLWEIEVAENVVPFNLFRIEQYYAGSILTFTSGELKGQSHRILHYRMKFGTDGMGNPEEKGVVFVIDQDPVVARENLVDSNGDGGIAPVDGDDFVVNDPPFNGTGLGFNPNNPSGGNKRTLSLTHGADPVALLPNIPFNFPDGRTGSISIEAGGADEPYDAPDYQNMFLAHVDGGFATSTSSIIPSFHRPELALYWFQRYINANSMTVGAFDNPMAFMQNPDLDTSGWMNGPSATDRANAWAMRRKFMLRPSKTDHPNFTGSNANFDILGTATNARWDIDNDLDGFADSIWIDIGLPLKTDRQGRRYRPLVAVMVKDLDGLINVNAHGFYSQFAEFEGSSFPPASTATPNDATTLLLAAAGMTNKHNQFSPSWDATGTTAQNMQLPLGSGYGPSEVSLRKIFGPREAYDLMDARYKGIGAFTSTTGTPGQDKTDDVRSHMDNIGLANVFNTTTNNRFGTPTDRLGLGRMYIDYAGRPRYMPLADGSSATMQTAPTGFGQRTDDPYEFDLIHGYRYDSPFSYQELERVLRYEEYDSSSVAESEDRLMDLASAALVGSPQNRRLITTASFQVPVANRVDIPSKYRDEDAVTPGDPPRNMMLTDKAAQARRPAPTLVTLLQERLRKENNWDPTTVAGKKLFKEKIYQLLPPEIMRGEPFDLNRLLEAPADGNGTDDIFELQSSASITFQSLYGTSSAQTPKSDFLNWVDGSANNANKAVSCNPPVSITPVNFTNPTSYSVSRQMMARYLYVMVLLLMEEDYQLPTIDPSLMTDASKRRELTKRRIAQWAINVVDFRDRDGVMTPFEYDLEPFKVASGVTTNDPWNVDGNLSTTEDSLYRRVVWGAEAPDLVLSETLAFHDRRTKDTKWDTDGRSRFSTPTPDDDLDQYRIPQGSLFIELYNPRNLQSNNNFFPPELYDLGANFGLALDRKSTGPNKDPVWRIIITKFEQDTSGSRTRENIVKEIADRPDYINFQPLPDMGTADQAGLAMDGTGVSKEQYDIERIILFTKPDPTTTPDARVFFYPGNSARRIVPDSYAVIGPRKTTYIGSKPRPTTMGMTDYVANNPGAQSIILTGDSDGVYVSSNMLAPTGGSRKGNNQDFAVVATKPNTITIDDLAHDPDGPPGAGGAAPYSVIGIGLSVSEPLIDDYYPGPTFQNSAPNLAVYDLYTDGTMGTLIQDVPFDTDPTPDNPLAIDSNISDTGTYPDKSSKGAAEFIKDYKTAILQRLANPLSDYNEKTNPYISVDHLGIDLTVFNGEDSHAAANAMDQLGTPGTDPGAADWDPDENHKDPRATTSTDVYFASREKGRRVDADPNNTPVAAELEGGTSSGNYFGTLKRLTSAITIGDITSLIPSFNETPPIHQSTVDTTLVTSNPVSDEHFGRKVVHSLGYVNHNLGVQIGSGVDATYLASPNPFESTHSLNPYDSTQGTTALQNNPLSYLHWPNAPFISEYDLMMVPTSSPQRLLFEYSQARKDASNSGDEAFYFESGSTNGDNLDAQMAPYSYLFNFFHGTKTDGLTASPSNDKKTLQLARLFDFVHVPSRFNGTNKWFNISKFNPDMNSMSGDLRNDSTKTEDPRLGYMFPFNRRSEFREPGKINLNTIPSQKVYDSIFDPAFWQGTDFNFATWDEFKASRRGFAGSTNSAFPSNFSNPFRPAAAAEMMPVLVGNDKRLQVAPEEAGLLRSVDRTVSPASDRKPLFDLRLTDGSLTNAKMRHYRTDDNPMLRYQAYQRLGNIAGTQSNVFAVWITVGYFEVEPVAISPTHPDGWRLAEELGNDTGEINRHRAFYIIDRSVPVGYVPGEDLNVEDTIMLKRFIE
ncbi:hypothetical protein C5Y96_17865 [Blastopirellula marina]|uniref:Uncharacterized protein n=1 Tax=Blastopirellula marina TaxID=124 RepID=A0A2S8F5H4_9BACT|nr:MULTISPECIES: hypothetical protein [Pirellulaceae]PQO27406.1 hypothetical protein C5Y96_17865 [Blastopirellula marina]RCS47943.1 hypothetical protein DTL36_17890 [Bremerella cremea]